MAPRKCTYLVRGRMCAKPGSGNPPLCDDHYDELHGPQQGAAEEMVDEFLDEVLDNREVQGVLGKVSSFIDKFSYLVDRAATPKTPLERREAVRDAFQATRGAAARVAAAKSAKRASGAPGANGGAQGGHKSPPPPMPRRPVGDDPLVVLGFPASTVLTVEMVKSRHKQLAVIYHSDRGGSDESMKRLNAARDQLLARIKK